MQKSVLVDLNELIGNHIPVHHSLFVQIRENSSNLCLLLVVKPPEYVEAIDTVTNPFFFYINCSPVNVVISGEHEQEVPTPFLCVELKQIALVFPSRISLKEHAFVSPIRVRQNFHHRRVLKFSCVEVPRSNPNRVVRQHLLVFAHHHLKKKQC